MHDTFRTVVLVVAIAVQGGCSDAPKIKPTVTDLVGTYRLAEQSREFLQSERSYVALPNSHIRLGSDGTVILEAIPDVYIDPFGESHGSSVSGKGTWEVIVDGPDYGLTFDISAGYSMPRASYHGSSILIRSRRPPYRIEMIVGDADERRSLIYERHES
jgi:hypothetical protein